MRRSGTTVFGVLRPSPASQQSQSAAADAHPGLVRAMASAARSPGANTAAQTSAHAALSAVGTERPAGTKTAVMDHLVGLSHFRRRETCGVGAQRVSGRIVVVRLVVGLFILLAVRDAVELVIDFLVSCSGFSHRRGFVSGPRRAVR